MAEPSVKLQNIEKRFGEFVAVERMDLDIDEGGFVTFLGPSGCGKTTTLRMIAGLLDPTEGDIYVKGKRVNDTPIHKRNLGIVFQNYALFPHKTIFENVGFGLKFRDVKGSGLKQRVKDALRLVQLPDVADRYPQQLSGGQQQRIALARALVIEPDVLLLDEPLSALDANLREDMRIELKRIQTQTGITSVFVTHDQAEALAMSDQVVVMSKGRVQQVGAPEDVYNTPVSEFVAEFLGTSNIFDVDVTDVDSDNVTVQSPALGTFQVPHDRAGGISGTGSARLVIRAEKLQLIQTDAAGNPGIEVPGVVETVDYQGHLVRYFVRVGDQKLQAVNMIEQHPLTIGQDVTVRADPESCTVLKSGTATG